MIREYRSINESTHLVADLLGIEYPEARTLVDRWVDSFGGIKYCVRDESAGREYALPLYILACYGDTEDAAKQYIKRHLVGTQRDASIPWLTDHGREELAWELQNGKQRERYDPRNKRNRG